MAEAWLNYAESFLRSAEGRGEDISAALGRALETAEAVGATVVISRTLASLTVEAFTVALAGLAVNESDAMLKLARFQDAADVALSGLASARQAQPG